MATGSRGYERFHFSPNSPRKPLRGFIPRRRHTNVDPVTRQPEKADFRCSRLHRFFPLKMADFCRSGGRLDHEVPPYYLTGVREADQRSEESRVGKEGVSTCRYRGWPLL